MYYEHFRSAGNQYLYNTEKITDEFSYPLHFHKSFEILFVEEGEKGVHINGKDFMVHKGECVLVLPGQFHSYYGAQNSVSWVCIFSVDFMPDFEKYCREHKHYPVFKINTESLYQKIHGFTMTDDEIFLIKSLLYHIAAGYCKEKIYNGFTEKNSNLMYEVIRYISEHFTESLSLQDVADKFGYNYRYMSGIVKNCFKNSFSKVLNQYRVDYACGLLKESENSITEISSLCGFNTLRSFNRSFKEIIGVTPSDYRCSKI